MVAFALPRVQRNDQHDRAPAYGTKSYITVPRRRTPPVRINSKLMQYFDLFNSDLYILDGELLKGRTMAGNLFLIVGPSGAGKDRLLNLARVRLPDHLFPKRYITRAAETGGETHVPVTKDRFREMAVRGEFLVHWYAHGLAYGISKDILPLLAAGRHVVINVSRTTVPAFERSYSQVTVVYVHASKDLLRLRLMERGRESLGDIDRRLDRAEPPMQARNIAFVDNSGDVNVAASHLIDILSTVSVEPA